MVVGFVDDLMDRSRISAAVPEARFVRSVAAMRTLIGNAEDLAGDTHVVVVVDLAKYAGTVDAIRVAVADIDELVVLVGFAPHVDEIARDTTIAGADRVMPRSRFFHDVGAAIGYC